MFKILGKTLQNHFCPFQVFENFLQEIFSNKSRKILASHICIIWWPWNVSAQSKLFWFTKVPKNLLCTDSNLNNFTLPNYSKCPQTLWSCSKSQIMTLHQVVHQGEWFCMTRSWWMHFCWFLGFTKVALATLPKWAQNWWKALIICAISPCGVSCQIKFIWLPKSATNTFCHFAKIPFFTSSTNLHGLNFVSQLLLTLFYL